MTEYRIVKVEHPLNKTYFKIEYPVFYPTLDKTYWYREDYVDYKTFCKAKKALEKIKLKNQPEVKTIMNLDSAECEESDWFGLTLLVGLSFSVGAMAMGILLIVTKHLMN